MSYRMDPAEKAEWLAALRGGDYGQCKGRLRGSESEFCCLGVYLDLKVKKGDGVWTRSHQDFTFPNGYMSRDLEFPETGTLPFRSPLNGYAATVDGLKGRNGSSVHLADLNDDGLTFSQIADVIDYFF